MKHHDYIDSGVEWLGQVPKGWIKKPLFTLARENKEKNGRNECNNLLSLSYGKIVRKDIMSNFGLIPQDYSGYQIVEKGTIILRLTDLQNDKRSLRTGFVSERGIITSAYIGLVPDSNLNSEYLTYVLHAYDVMKVFYTLGSGVRQSMNFKDLKWIPIFLPDDNEQCRIVSYVKRKTSQIDRLIADKQKLIELLKEQRQSIISEAVTKGIDASVPMKNSGIEWIGKIPSHWNVTRGKNILHLMKRPPADDCEVVTCFRDGEVTRRSNRREDGFTFADKEIGYQGIEVGDLVIHGMDGFAGSIGISDSSGKGSPVLCVCRAKKSGVESFYMYYLRALAVQDVFLALSTGIRERSCDLRWNKISTLLFPIPPENEQAAIVKHIGDKMAQIDAVIQQCNNQIALLKEYRQSIISEAVTGKYIVPAVDTPTEATSERQANIHFKRRVLAAKILDELCDEPTLGHVKLEKILFLGEYCGQLELHTQFTRHAAGPYSPQTLRSIDSQLKKSKWFSYSKSANKSNKYTRLSDSDKYVGYYESYFDGEQRSTIDKLLGLFRTARTLQCEIVATLYGAWNDFLLEGITPSDNQIIDEVLSNWHEEKERISHERWQGALNWMRENAIIPVGYGESTKGGALQNGN